MEISLRVDTARVFGEVAYVALVDVCKLANRGAVRGGDHAFYRSLAEQVIGFFAPER